MHALDLRREAAIEAHHQGDRLRCRSQRCLDSVRFIHGQPERLLDEDVLACLDGLQHETSVPVMARRDHDRVGPGVGEQRCRIGGGPLEAELAPCVQSGDPSA